MTPDAPPHTLEEILRASWTRHHTQPIPAAWLADTLTAIANHLSDIRSADTPQTVTAGQTPDPFRQRVHRRLADAAIDDMLDVETANTILDDLGLPLLPRFWQVRLNLPVVIEVTAATSDDAFDTAENVIEDALTDTALAVHIPWEARDSYRATPGALDTDAIDQWIRDMHRPDTAPAVNRPNRP